MDQCKKKDPKRKADPDQGTGPEKRFCISIDDGFEFFITAPSPDLAISKIMDRILNGMIYEVILH